MITLQTSKKQLVPLLARDQIIKFKIGPGVLNPSDHSGLDCPYV